LEKEVEVIEHIASRNNISSHVRKTTAQRLIRKRLLALITTHESEKKKEKWVRQQPYMGRISHQISRVSKKSRYRSSFYTINLLRFISKTKDSISTHKKVACISWSMKTVLRSMYIGQIGRPLDARIREHMNC